jgi:hypothetical protein
MCGQDHDSLCQSSFGLFHLNGLEKAKILGQFNLGLGNVSELLPCDAFGAVNSGIFYSSAYFKLIFHQKKNCILKNPLLKTYFFMSDKKRSILMQNIFFK